MESPEVKEYRLLLVDNQNDGLKTMESVLKRRYTHVDLCENLESLKHNFLPGKYDMVIVALEMDENEGYKCIDYIAQSDPGQRIITYSAEPEQPSHGQGCEVCLRENRRHRIQKPVLLKELYCEIENFDALYCTFAETAMKMYQGYMEKK